MCPPLRRSCYLARVVLHWLESPRSSTRFNCCSLRERVWWYHERPFTKRCLHGKVRTRRPLSSVFRCLSPVAVSHGQGPDVWPGRPRRVCQCNFVLRKALLTTSYPQV